MLPIHIPVLYLCFLFAVAAAHDILLATFDGAEGTTHQWQQMNDPVMGGELEPYQKRLFCEHCLYNSLPSFACREYKHWHLLLSAECSYNQDENETHLTGTFNAGQDHWWTSKIRVQATAPSITFSYRAHGFQCKSSQAYSWHTNTRFVCECSFSFACSIDKHDLI